MRTYDILNAGPKNRFMANGKIVSNSGALIQPQNLTRPSTNNMNIPEGSKPLDNYDISEMDIELAASGNLDLIQQYWKDPKVLASDCLRAMIHARKGYDFICADYSGIEARALAYLAGEEYVLQGFRDGLDPYKVAATTIYGVKYEDVDKKQRQVGKTATLACFSADTMVYTRDGVKKIVDVTKDDYVWDGENWCLTDGAYCQGVKEVVNFLGVEVTPDQKWLMGENIWVRSDAGKVLLETFTEIFKSCPCAEKQGILYMQDVLLVGENAMYPHGMYCLEEQLNVLNADENLELKQSQNTIQWNNLTREDGFVDYTRQLADAMMKEIQLMNGMEPEELKYIKNGWKIKIPSLNICVELTIGMTQDMKSTALITTVDTFREILGVSWDETIKETRQEIDLYHMMEDLCALLIFGVSIAPNIEARESLVNYLKEEFHQKKSLNQCQKESGVNTTKYIMSKKFFTVEKNYPSMSFGKNMFRGIRKNLIFNIDSTKGRVLNTLSKTKKNDKIENVYDLLNCGDKNRFTIYTVCGPRIVHNCGYGGGYGAFLRFGADRMGIDEEEGKKIIAAWRDGHPMTVKLWHKLVEAAVMAMTNKGGIYSYRGISFQYYKRFLLMKLPSGRFLFYFEPKLEDVEMAWSTPEKPAFKKLVTAMTLTPEKQFVRRPLNHLIISENCFSGETKVLTDSGWKCIKDITLFDKVFDGEKFVFHGGLVCKGKQPVQTRLQVRATKDHLILVGSAWKKFSKMEKSDWYTALEVGRNSVDLLLLNPSGVNSKSTQKLNVSAGKDSEFKRVKSGWDSICLAPNAQQKQKDIVGGSQSKERFFRTIKSAVCGRIDTQESFRDATTQTIKRTPIMEGEGYKFSGNGKRTDLNSFDMSKLFRDGTHLDVTLTESTTTETMSPVICGLCQGAKTPTINGTPLESFIKVKNIPSENLEKNSLLRGGKQQSFTIEDKGTMPSTWSEDMSKQESEVEVFDIKNCGDLHRYCVLTSEGPIIVHNCTQAFCRDLMVNAMFNLEEANYPVVFHVHDEIIAEVLKGFGSVEEFENIMCKLPQWAEGLPVKAEGWRGEFYRK